MRDPFEQLRRIQEAIGKITSYVQKGRRKFDREEAIRLSIIYYLQMISEAVNTLSADFKAHYSEIPWQQFSGFQIFLTHYYNDIDQDALWNIVEHDLPLLAAQIDAQFTLDDRITEQNKSIDLAINNDHSGTATALRKLLQTKRKEILLAARKHGASNVRVFGSVVQGKADEKSDIDFLVDMEPGRTLFDLSGFLLDLEDLLGREVDVITEKGLHDRIRERVLKEAMPL